MVQADTQRDVSPRHQARAWIRVRPVAVRLAFEALLLGGALALWVGLDVLFRDSQQAQGVPLAEGAGLVILGTGLCLTLVTVGRAIRSTKVAVPEDDPEVLIPDGGGLDGGKPGGAVWR